MARIAVVDDHPSARLFAAACLKQRGHEADEIEPTCLCEVLGAMHRHPPDLLVTDLVMPGCPGMTLIRACREDPHLKHLKILLLTAHGDRKLARFLQIQGNVHFLSKPVAPQELTECVDRFLKGDLDVDLGWTLDCQGVVAVVDDSRLSRVFHMSCLRQGGFKPLEVVPDNLTSVLKRLEEAQPDALVLDFLMPNFRGDALIRALRASSVATLRVLPVLLVTAHKSDQFMSPNGQAEHVDILYKPVHPGDLTLKVQELLRLREGS